MKFEKKYFQYIFLVLLILLGFKYWPVILILHLFFRTNAIKLLLIVNVLELIFGDYGIPKNLILVQYPTLLGSPLVIPLKVLIIAFSIHLLYAFYLIGTKSRMALVLAIFSSYYFLPIPEVQKFLYLSIHLLVKQVLFLILFYLENHRLRYREFIKHSIFLFPFYGLTVPILGTLYQLEHSRVHSDEEKKAFEVSGFKFILAMLGLYILSQTLHEVFFGKSLFQNEFSFLSHLNWNLPDIYKTDWPQAFDDGSYITFFGAILLRVFIVVCTITIGYGLQVGILRVLGFKAPTCIDRPWISKSFFDFFKRLQNNYGEFLSQVFINRAFLLFYKIKNFKFRIAISVFISVVVLGFLVRIAESPLFFMSKSSITNKLQIITSFIAYAAALGFLCATSIMLYDQNKKSATVFSATVRSIVYFTVFSLLFYLFMLKGAYSKSDLLFWQAKVQMRLF